MSTQQIQLSNYSMYKDTPVYLDPDNVIRFALWVPPAEFLSGQQGVGATNHTVVSAEVGFLDLIAFKYYGPGYERMWRAIMQANAMTNPETDMYPGQVLTIPPRSSVQQFLGRQGLATNAAD